MQDILNAYADAFTRCYPTYTVGFQKAKSREGKPVFNVVLNGDKGNRPMTLDEIREAAAALSR
jgi:hypothetical protein